MADNVTLPGAGATIATDDVDLGGGAAQVQYVKLADGTANGTDVIPGTAARGLSVDPRPDMVRVTVAPTVSTTPAYASKDAVGGWMEFANVVRASGGWTVLEAVQVIDRDMDAADMDLTFFDRDISGTSPVTDNAVFDPVDADLDYMVGIVPIFYASFGVFNDNATAHINTNLVMKANGTSLWAVLVSRDTPTYTATTDLKVVCTFRRL